MKILAVCLLFNFTFISVPVFFVHSTLFALSTRQLFFLLCSPPLHFTGLDWMDTTDEDDDEQDDDDDE